MTHATPKTKSFIQNAEKGVKHKLHIFLWGLCAGVTMLSVMLLIMFLRGDFKGLLAAGVGTGAADVNARYLDGFGTQQGGALTANKVYVSDGSGKLPAGAVDPGNNSVTSAMIVDNTILNADINSSANISRTKIGASVTSAQFTSSTLNTACNGQQCSLRASCASGNTLDNLARAACITLGYTDFIERTSTTCLSGASACWNYDTGAWVNDSSCNGNWSKLATVTCVR